MMNMHDRYYQPPEDDYDDEAFDAAVETYAEELILGRCNPNLEENWGEGLSECGYDEELYPTPSHAPVEVIERVASYWYSLAVHIAKRHYEDHPEALYD